MKSIVAIGGGELNHGDTLAIDRRIIALTGKAKPHTLLIPTASGDHGDYEIIMRRMYGDKLGCTMDVLYLIKGRRLTSQAIAEKIAAADLIYVGGGNTLRMMKLWRKRGVDRLLHAAYQNGTVLSGISAGAICWFAYGHSDSRSFTTEGEWDYIRVRGMGLVDAIFCPHVDGENRREHFTAFMGKYSHVGLGFDDNIALEIIDDHYRVITSQDGATAYKIYRQRGHGIITEPLLPHDTPLPLGDLLAK